MLENAKSKNSMHSSLNVLDQQNRLGSNFAKKNKQELIRFEAFLELVTCKESSINQPFRGSLLAAINSPLSSMEKNDPCKIIAEREKMNFK